MRSRWVFMISLPIETTHDPWREYNFGAESEGKFRKDREEIFQVKKALEAIAFEEIPLVHPMRDQQAPT